MMTIGVLFSNADNFAQMEMWRGINNFAKKNNIHLIALMSTYQSSHEDLAVHVDTCFNLIYNSTYLDGVIFFSGFVSHLMGDAEAFAKYVERMPKYIPCVSLSQIIPGVPSILADNVSGIYDAVDHLIKVHGRKQIAFQKGPDGQPEAEARLIGYKNALADNGIEFDPNYVLPGNFSHEGARRATVELLDVRKLPFDALSASNDISAVQFLREFKQRGIQVPEEVIVTGFDDDREAATFIPSLSTARQDFYSMGIEAASTLMDMIDGKKVQPVTSVPCVFIPRQSCGCFKREYSGHHGFELTDTGTTLVPFVTEKLMPIFPDRISKRRRAYWIETLTTLLVARPFRKKDFLQSMDEMLVAFSHRSTDFSVWHEVINICTLATRRFAREVDDTNLILETLLHSTAFVNEMSSNEARVEADRQSDLRMALRRVTGALVLIFEIDILAAELCRLLPQVDINMALLGMYQHPVKSDDSDADRNFVTVIGFDGDTQIYMKNNSWNPVHFSDFSTVDDFDYNRERRSLFFIPLFFKDEELGAIILPYDPGINIHAYETLRVNLSTAIKGAELLNRIQTLSITDDLTGLLNRRGFFQFVYSRLEHMRRVSETIPIVMFMDMDDLKMINDTYGHKEGDNAIAALSSVLKDALRKEDIIGRVGGDEFVVFSSVKSKETGDHVANRIRAKLDDYNAKSGLPYKIACSIGSVILEEATRECFETAILSADAVLYEEKMSKKKAGLSRR